MALLSGHATSPDDLGRAKAYLLSRHSLHQALHTREEMTWNVGTDCERAKELQSKLDEFMNYVEANLDAIPNYADRCRHGELITIGFVESAVIQVVSKQRVTKQQMRCTPAGAQKLLQVRVRVRVLNHQLRGDFERWDPSLRSSEGDARLAA